MNAVGLMMNVDEKKLSAVLKILPSLKSPTISDLSRKGWFDIFTVLREEIARDIIPKLKEAGAQGIVEFPLNKIID
ncbi:MAG: hypothetical protein V1831_00330 [Candidatus Woesearchaeota archaeon]